MSKEPSEMLIEELDAIYGEPVQVAAVMHVLEKMENFNHDRFTFEVITEDSKRLQIPFTQSALQSLVWLIGDSLNTPRPKVN